MSVTEHDHMCSKKEISTWNKKSVIQAQILVENIAFTFVQMLLEKL